MRKPDWVLARMTWKELAQMTREEIEELVAPEEPHRLLRQAWEDAQDRMCLDRQVDKLLEYWDKKGKGKGES